MASSSFIFLFFLIFFSPLLISGHDKGDFVRRSTRSSSVSITPCLLQFRTMNGDQIVVDKETPDMLNTLGMNEIPGIFQVDPVPVQKSFRFGRGGFGGAGRRF
ncbi:hypothetical protein K1719_002652 [Acacia pycnantha]|nr:hypothetical protein K1719_002652 [Acacia pycnantha]